MTATAQLPHRSSAASSATTSRVSTATRRKVVSETSQMVFVVDDDAMMASLIGATMEGAGYQVRVFTDGAEASTLAATLPPALLLVDLTMPQLSGAETMARLRKLQPMLPVVVISGVPKDEARATVPEANAFLEKPFQFSTLLRAVAGQLGR